jgi:hypothetical protein
MPDYTHTHTYRQTHNNIEEENSFLIAPSFLTIIVSGEEEKVEQCSIKLISFFFPFVEIRVLFLPNKQ